MATPGARNEQSGSPSKMGPSCSVELSVVDAIGVGLSLQTIAATRPMPVETAESYRRVGAQLESAARLELAKARQP